MTITLHKGDLPANVTFGASVAVDCEMMGLNPQRDRLCLVQLSSGDGTVHLVQILKDADAPHLKKLMTDTKVEKIFHFARADLWAIYAALGVMTAPVYCTKVASRLARTFTDHHSLKTLCKDVLGVELEKQQQSSDWGADTLTQEQMNYAASDVLYLHRLKDALQAILVRENRAELAKACFDFLPHRAHLDAAGWAEQDIFSHSV
jgi:ribonuclease D